MDKKVPQLTAIDLFAGAGGLSTGLTWAGWNVIAAIEKDTWATASHRKSHSHTTMIHSDVRDIAFGDYKGIDLIAGGLPANPSR